MKKIMTEEISLATAKNNFRDCLLITIHGVKYDNTKIEDLAKQCKDALPGLEIEHFYYECLHPALVLGRTSRELAAFKVKTDIKTIKEKSQQNKEYKDIKKFFVFAHSFGTLTLFRYLQGADKSEDLSFETAVLAGSILPQGTEWRTYIDRNLLSRRIYNITRPFDWVVRAASFLLAEQTVSGTRGFIKIGLEKLAPLNIFKLGGHSGYVKADAKDIVLIIRGEIDKSWVCSEDEFKNKLSRIEKIRLITGRALGLI